MGITVKEIEHLANLARLSLSDEEKTRLQDEVGNIIAFADKINEIDVSDINPTMHAADIYNVFREDEIKKSFSTEKILQNAPENDGKCFVVPKTVE
ncbi:MAG: Asp-tRNA(Asn)/Glu-tRNA(Gln) amidotransferase subunit GatC [Clostridia bacterium]|nr:Asp-tRNA(Asn)/Glu-tRNA(Gln) amidotransferase subunit GatC [Clostridia bacterium]